MIAGFAEGGAQTGIAGYAAGGSYSVQEAFFCGANGFRYQNFDDSCLNAGAEVANGLVVLQGFGVFFEEVAHGGFEAAKTEVVVVFLQHRTRKGEGVGVSFGGQSIYFWAAGVGEADEFGGFVEAFAGGIIKRVSQHFVAKWRIDAHEQGVSSADNQGDVRAEFFEFDARRLAGNPRGV